MESKSIEDDVIQIQARSMSDQPLYDIDFKNNMARFFDARFRALFFYRGRIVKSCTNFFVISNPGLDHFETDHI